MPDTPTLPKAPRKAIGAGPVEPFDGQAMRMAVEQTDIPGTQKNLAQYHIRRNEVRRQEFDAYRRKQQAGRKPSKTMSGRR